MADDDRHVLLGYPEMIKQVLDTAVTIKIDP
jgi:hypothetical protein